MKTISLRSRFGQCLLLALVLGMPVFAAESAVEGVPLNSLVVPPGFVIERVATYPQVEHPMMASFDDTGRLYVADSSGVNKYGFALLENPPHRILMLQDKDGDGVFESSSIFADKMVFPQGLLWHDGAVYCSSPPSLWKLEDTDGDGVADKRTELLTGFANRGVSDDLHGTCLGPDGRIYFCPGRFPHEIKTLDGRLLRKGTSPLIMRCRGDGRDAEVVCGAHGNPVEVAFTDEGEAFASGTFMGSPAARDAIIHCVEGGQYPILDRVLNEHKRTGALLPPLIAMGVTAPAGMTRYRGEALGGEFTGNLVCSYFNTHKVQRHILERDGATFRARTEDFLTCTNVDFHPTDVLEDADGSLLVVDTGGWFRIGCPTSQISKPQIKGAIYRIRRKEAPKVSDPRGVAIVWKEIDRTALAALLNDSRVFVRERAIEEFARRGTPAIPSLIKTLNASESALARRNAVWALCRSDAPEARAGIRAALADKDFSVRQSAVYCAGLHKDADAAPKLIELLAVDHAPTRREAATALGRIRTASAVPALLENVRRGGDRFLEHAVIFALIQIADREAMLKSMRDSSSPVRRAALIVLDQMEGENLTQELVAPLLDPADRILQQEALRIISSRPGWAGQAADFVRQTLAMPEIDSARGELVRNIIAAFAKDTSTQDLVAQALRDAKTLPAARLVLLQSIAQAPLETLPEIWTAELRWSLDSTDERVRHQDINVLRLRGMGQFAAVLARIAQDASQPEELRVEALAAYAPRMTKLDGTSFQLLKEVVSTQKPPLLRLLAANTLGAATLQDMQLNELATVVATAGPLELPRLLPAWQKTKSEGPGKNLLAVLESAPAFRSLNGALVRETFKDYPKAVSAAAAELAKKLDSSEDVEEKMARLKQLEPALSDGDPKRGKTIFFSQKALCSTCHTIDSLGGKVGPDLSKVGSIRSKRDLLEAIVFPSASLARGFESYVVKTKDKKIISGIIARETSDAIYVYGTDRIEVHVARSDIQDLKASPLSIMPQGLESNFKPDELRDIISFLHSLR